MKDYSYIPNYYLFDDKTHYLYNGNMFNIIRIIDHDIRPQENDLIHGNKYVRIHKKDGKVTKISIKQKILAAEGVY